MNATSKRIAVAAGCLAIAGCQTVPTDVSEGREVREVRDVPVLKSDDLESEWGPGESESLVGGGHRITYRSDQESMTIESLAEAVPVPRTPPNVSPGMFGGAGSPQQWREVSILGQPVKWFTVSYETGAEHPEFETVVFPLTHPDGRTGYYRIRVSAFEGEEAAKLFPRVTW